MNPTCVRVPVRMCASINISLNEHLNDPLHLKPQYTVCSSYFESVCSQYMRVIEEAASTYNLRLCLGSEPSALETGLEPGPALTDRVVQWRD